MTTRKTSACLALLLAFLIALPPAAFADDTELFTTSANPNVLLMLDSTGSMREVAGSSVVGDLDGDTDNNTRMDVLWKVVYTLLNADLSTPTYPSTIKTTVTCSLISAGYYDKWGNPVTDTGGISSTSRRYYTLTVTSNDKNWSQFPASGTVKIGYLTTSQTFSYTSRTSGGASGYVFTISGGKKFSKKYPSGSTITYDYTSTGPPVDYPENFPTTNPEATSTDFLNNLNPLDDENILKARLGLMTFSTSGAGLTVWNQTYPTDNNSPPFNTSYRTLWSTLTNNVWANGGTPTARALQRAKTYFKTATSNNTVDICRQNVAVMITDGEDTMGGGSNGASGNGGGPYYYKSGSTYSQDNFSGATFKADGWINNPGQVARNNGVVLEAANLATSTTTSPSVTLYTVGVGIGDNQPHLAVHREVLRRAAEQANAQATSGQYDVVGGSVDNTSRAAGKAFFATDATDLSIALRNIFQQITAGMYSFTAPTVASVRMTDRNYLYKAIFTPAAPPKTFWGGHLEALSINADNTMTSHWDAGEMLRTTLPGDRRIYTSDNTWSRVDFTTGSITTDMLGVDNTDARDNVVNYVLGANHDNNAKLGDIFHSKPVVVGPPSRFFFDQGYSTIEGTGATQSFAEAQATRKRVVYVGTNDGMLHAFLSGTYQTSGTFAGQYDSGTGAELFGYVPHHLLGNLESFLPGDVTRHGYFVDSSPRVADVWLDDGDGTKQSSEWKTVLIGGMRKGGNGYFALDVTDPDASDYPKVLWEYTDPANITQTWSEPFIGKVKVMSGSPATSKDRWVAIFGGGKSDAGTIGASLVVLDIATGTALKTFTTGIDNVIPASPAAVLDGNGYIKFAYVADLDGSLYKFDFRNPGSGSAYTEWTMKKIFQASPGQPVYHRVEAGTLIPGETTRYLFFGTGDQENPVSNTGTGKFYSVKDTDGFWPTSPLTESDLADLSASVTSLSGGTVGPTQSGWLINFATTGFASSLTNDTFGHFGEKVLSDPVVFYNVVYFTTFTPNVSNPCGGGGIARVYGLKMLNAGAGLEALAPLGETSTKVPYHVYSGSDGGIPSSPSLSIYPSGQSSIFVGFSTGTVKEIKIESPPQMKSIKSWKEIF